MSVAGLPQFVRTSEDMGESKRPRANDGLPRPLVQETVTERLADLLEWSRADRSLLLLSVSLPFVLASLAQSTYFLAHPEYTPFFDLQQLAHYRAYIGAAGAVELLLATVIFIGRRRFADAYWTEVVCILFSALFHVGAAFYFGLFTTSLLMVIVIFGSLFYFLFERRTALIGIGAYLVAATALAVLEQAGVIPYAPLLTTAPFSQGHLSTSWFWGMGVFFLLVAVVAVAYFDVVIGRWRAREQSLRALTVTDPLTGVANRRRLFEFLQVELARGARYPAPLSCLVADLDHFKRINDSHGHQVGDQVLAMAAQALSRSVRITDLVARYGGEEFVLVLPQTSVDNALIVAERCRAALSELRILGPRGPVAVRASFGVTGLAATESARAEELLGAADKALYKAKEQGRDRVCVASSMDRPG